MLLLVLSGCKKEEEALDQDNIKSIANISRLYTIEAYYNNVAKATKEAGKGILHLGEKDRDFWVEYKGYVKLGVDLDKDMISLEDNIIYIDMPDATIIGEPQVLSETLTEESYTIEKDSRINSNVLTPKDTTEAIAEAQANMIETISRDTNLQDMAKERAKLLIKEYIESIERAIGVDYELVFR